MKNKKENKKYAVSPKEYAEYIKGVNIGEIKFENGSFQFINADLLNKNKSIKIKYERTPELVETHEGNFVVRDKLVFSVIETSSRKHIVDIKCCLLVVYRHKDGIAKEMFKPFGDFNVPVNTWPYFREFVNSAITRMGLPTFTLPAWNTVK